MHDPMTVAFEFRLPWPRRPRFDGESYRPAFLTIWHVDPERHGDDDSCDWFNHKRKHGPMEDALQAALWDLETLLDNEPHYPSSPEHLRFQPLSAACRAYLRQPSRTHWWQLHPRWHVWHWSIQIHALQNFKRWAFSRCIHCGGRFRWGETPVGGWNSKGPSWLGREQSWHSNCDGPPGAVRDAR